MNNFGTNGTDFGTNERWYKWDFTRETRNLYIAVGLRPNPFPGRLFANSRLFLFFLIALSRAAFCRVLVSVCEEKLYLCVNIVIRLVLFFKKTCPIPSLLIFNFQTYLGALRWAGERSSVETQTVFDKIPKERREQVFKIDFSKLITREDLKHLSDVESDENDESELSESPEIFNPVWEFLTKKKPACNTINLEKLPTKNDIYSSDEKIAINDDFESFQVLSTKHLDELDKLSKGMQSSEKKRPFTLNLTKASNMINQHLNGSTSATSNISFNSM